MKDKDIENKISRLLIEMQNKKLQDKRVYEEVLQFIRKWSMAKARRSADINATIERRHNKSISVLKNIAVMMKPKEEDPVDWSKIHSTEDEFLEIDKSIESEVESVSS